MTHSELGLIKWFRGRAARPRRDSAEPTRLKSSRQLAREADRLVGAATGGQPYAVYLRSQGHFHCAASKHLVGGPPINGGGGLAHVLKRARMPVSTARSHRSATRLESLSQDERQELRRMGAIAVFPLLVDSELFGFVLLGHREATGPGFPCDPVRVTAVADRLALAMARLPELQRPRDPRASWRMSLRLGLT